MVVSSSMLGIYIVVENEVNISKQIQNYFEKRRWILQNTEK